MSKTVQSQHRITSKDVPITVSPAVLFERMPIERFDLVRRGERFCSVESLEEPDSNTWSTEPESSTDTDGDSAQPVTELASRWQRQELPTDVLIRELRHAQLDRPQGIQEFMATYGEINLRDFPVYRIVAHRKNQPFEQENDDGVHWEQLALFLRSARALGSHWERFTNGEDLRGAWTEEGFAQIDDDDSAWVAFAEVMNEGMSHPAFSPHYTVVTNPSSLPDVEPEQQDRNGPGWPDDLLTDTPILPDLFAGLCLQMHQIVVQGRIVQLCANETCNNSFVEQRDGKGVRTKGLLYCSQSCANAQMQRQSRRRNKQFEPANRKKTAGTAGTAGTSDASEAT